MSETESAIVSQAISETHGAGVSDQQTPRSSDMCLSNAETLQLVSQLLDVKFDQTFAAFKCNLEEKEATTQSQRKKLKTEYKPSNSFNFKADFLREEW